MEHADALQRQMKEIRAREVEVGGEKCTHNTHTYTCTCTDTGILLDFRVSVSGVSVVSILSQVIT